ncbi:MAG: guanylate kinase [Lentisphaerae bacterium]|nr:guanylate kinase [Lentisphaerota bacterium]
MKRALLIVISSPSGGGKTTLCQRLLAMDDATVQSVSCTTRAARPGEVDGKHYHFISVAEFERRMAAGEFLEHAKVHGHLYGTLRAPVAEAIRSGKSVLLAIDVQGAAQVRDSVRRLPAGDAMRRGYMDVFIQPPSLEALRRRLVGRGQDRPEVIERRLAAAEAEMRRAAEYGTVIVNDDFDTAAAELMAVVERERNGGSA